MMAKFTDRARKVMQLANQEAIRFNHDYIGTEHILLGLVQEGTGVAANVLKNLDIDLRKVRLEVEKTMKVAPDMATMSKLPFTPPAKKAIESAIAESQKLHHNYVGTEHLLLGILSDDVGVGAQVLLNLGFSLTLVRQEVVDLLGPSRTALEAIGSSGEPSEYSDAYFKHLPPYAQAIINGFGEQIELLQIGKEQAIAEQDFDRAALMRDMEERLKKMRAKFLGQWPKP
jgi:ATP-dependent Clp protease ATP-binding subunit ClpC